MFPPYPGLQDAHFRVEVEWQEQKRPVAVHFETWPEPLRAVLVCRFEDEPADCEWLILQGSGTPHFVGSPHKLLFEWIAFDVTTRKQVVTRHLKEQRIEKLRGIVQRAFKADDFRVGRLLQLRDLPDEPRTALLSSFGNVWYSPREQAMPTAYFNPFKFSLTSLDATRDSAEKQLLAEWNNPESDARFAWQWARWTDEERQAQLTGYHGDFGEVERVMKWVLINSTSLWQLDDGWLWALHPEYEGGQFWWSQSMVDADDNVSLQRWQKWLLQYFAPQWRGDWLEEYTCAHQFWLGRVLGEAEINAPPTMHEQLEARLELRAWLQDKATPEEIDKLLAN